MHYLSLLLCLTASFAFSALGFALAGKALGLHIQEVSMFVGPRLVGLRILGIRYSLRLLPLGSWVRFGTEADDLLPEHERSFMAAHPLVRAVVNLASPAVLILASCFLLGSHEAARHFWSLGALFTSLAGGDRGLSDAGREMMQFFQTSSVREALGATAGTMGAISLLPIPMFSLGQALVELAHTIRPLTLELRERLAIGGFIATLLLVGMFAYALISQA